MINTQNAGGCCTHDPNIVKRSTMNTKGLIEATVEHPTVVFNAECVKDCTDSVTGHPLDPIVAPILHIASQCGNVYDFVVPQSQSSRTWGNYHLFRADTHSDLD